MQLIATTLGYKLVSSLFDMALLLLTIVVVVYHTVIRFSGWRSEIVPKQGVDLAALHAFA